jgi:hypothetical protein
MTTRDRDLHELTALRERSDRADFFIQKAVCEAVTRGDAASTYAMLEQRFGRHSPLLAKAAVPAMTTESGLAESRLEQRAFLALVARQYAFEAIPFTVTPPNVTLGIEQQPAVATRVSEGAAIAVAAGDLTTARVRPSKIATIRILTDELARRPDAAPTIERMMARDVGTAVDTAAFDPSDAESLTFGATTIMPTGTYAEDVADLLAVLTDGVAARPWLVLGAAVARRWYFSGDSVFHNVRLAGRGDVGGVPCVVSPTTALRDLAVAIDLDGVAVSDLGIAIDRAEHASLQMADDPDVASADASSPRQPVATSLVSLWASNSIGLRAIRHVGWARRANAISLRDYSGSPA